MALIDKRHLPWRDRAGRLSVLKLVTFVATLAPAVWMTFELASGWLRLDAIEETIHQSGTWAVRFVLISLAVTPFRRIGPWGKLIVVRRMLGLAGFGYTGLHLALYVVDQRLDVLHVVAEIASRFYLTIGFASLLGLTILAATSTDGMIRRIGGRRWQTLHKSAYASGILALLHFMLQARLDISQPILVVGLFLMLMGWRALQTRGLGDSVAALMVLAATSGIATAVLEASWYQIRNHLSVLVVLEANLSIDEGLRPAVWVLVVGTATAALRAARVALAARRGIPSPHPWSTLLARPGPAPE